MNLIFIAPPAAGKGTISEKLKNEYGYNHISAGDVLREEMASGSELGNEIKSIVEQGLLVDNNLVKRLMHKKLSSLDKSKGFIFDGYPRTVEQVGHYKEICEDLGIELAYGVYLEIDKDVALRRALGRYSCPVCKKGYNIYSEEFKPKNEGLCDECNVALEARSDDNEESFSRRYDTYLNETKPVMDILEAEGRLVKFDSNGGSNIAFDGLKKFLEERK